MRYAPASSGAEQIWRRARALAHRLHRGRPRNMFGGFAGAVMATLGFAVYRCPCGEIAKLTGAGVEVVSGAGRCPMFLAVATIDAAAREPPQARIHRVVVHPDTRSKS